MQSEDQVMSICSDAMAAAGERRLRALEEVTPEEASEYFAEWLRGAWGFDPEGWDLQKAGRMLWEMMQVRGYVDLDQLSDMDLSYPLEECERGVSE